MPSGSDRSPCREVTFNGGAAALQALLHGFKCVRDEPAVEYAVDRPTQADGLGATATEVAVVLGAGEVVGDVGGRPVARVAMIGGTELVVEHIERFWCPSITRAVRAIPSMRTRSGPSGTSSACSS